MSKLEWKFNKQSFGDRASMLTSAELFQLVEILQAERNKLRRQLKAIQPINQGSEQYDHDGM